MFISKENAHAQTLVNENKRVKMDTWQLRQLIDLKIKKKIDSGRFNVYIAISSIDMFHVKAIASVIDELQSYGYRASIEADALYIEW